MSLVPVRPHGATRGRHRPAAASQASIKETTGGRCREEEEEEEQLRCLSFRWSGANNDIKDRKQEFPRERERERERERWD